MGKRSDFPRIERDKYATPYEGIIALLPHLRPGTRFDEPCCGDGDLIRHLEAHGHKCAGLSDITPSVVGAAEVDALKLDHCTGECFITNPPWGRKILHPLIERLSGIAPTWLLFDADWQHTRQAAPFMRHCHRIVSVGRLKWIPGSKMTGKDNCCWYLFDRVTPRMTVAPLSFWREEAE